MFRNLLEGWYGYPHIHCTFPITLRDASQCDTSSSSTRTYFVCLDCGKEFPYDWREMKVLKRFPATRTRHWNLQPSVQPDLNGMCI